MIDSAGALCLHPAMLGRLRQSNANLVVAAFYALAMALLGFAHKPIYFPTRAGVELAAYFLPDGTAPSICGESDDRSPVVHDHHCDACALNAAPGLLATPQACLPARVGRLVAQLPWRLAQFEPAPRHAPTSRGPPRA